MKTLILCFLLITCFSNRSLSQIKYSAKIPKQQLNVLKQLEKKLRNSSFSFDKIISNTPTRLSDADSTNMASLFTSFFDTSQVRLLPAKQLSYIDKQQEESWFRAMTVNSIIGIYNLLHCAPDSLFFVTPVQDVVLIDKDNELQYNPSENMLVAGYKAGGYYYPAITILFTGDSKKIVYMNILLQFEKYSKEKEAYAEKYLNPLITPCLRTFSEEYGKENVDSLKVEAIKVDN